ncbi:MAG TPA: UDP-N-acetylglucosamine 2-epimerase (non-hydrolyzing) [Longimicrobiales bacterium]
MKVLTVVGARPQFVKAAPLSRALATDGISEILVHTGQHYDHAMAGRFFEELGIRAPDVNLGVGSDSHGRQTARMLEGIEAVLVTEEPDWVVVYGDTNSTLAGALAAAKLHIPVAHIEAGLRSFNRRMPEEVNRVLTDHAAELLFCPTATAVENLRREGFDERRIHLVGDVMYDAAILFAARAEHLSDIRERLGLDDGGYVVATVHRAENTDSPARLSAILCALARVAAEVPVVLPLHPRTRAAIERYGLALPNSDRVRIIEPVGYLDMLMLLKGARVVATDSGGVQKEAFFAGAPCVTLRTETEWVELVDAGWNRLAPPDDEHAMVDRILTATPPDTDAPATIYGDGSAARRIARILSEGPSRRDGRPDGGTRQGERRG